jgi:hypothetical protein
MGEVGGHLKNLRLSSPEKKGKTIDELGQDRLLWIRIMTLYQLFKNYMI